VAVYVSMSGHRPGPRRAGREALLITGAPGVGKSEAAPRVATGLTHDVAVVELDHLAALVPWRVDAHVFDLMARNLSHLLDEYLGWGLTRFVVVGVMLPGLMYDRVAAVLTRHGITWDTYGLRACPDTLTRRIMGDPRFRDSASRLRDRDLDRLVGTVPRVVEIATDDLTVDEVAERILDLDTAKHSADRARLSDH
jgi:hypothetical protein